MTPEPRPVGEQLADSMLAAARAVAALEELQRKPEEEWVNYLTGLSLQVRAFRSAADGLEDLAARLANLAGEGRTSG